MIIDESIKFESEYTFFSFKCKSTGLLKKERNVICFIFLYNHAVTSYILRNRSPAGSVANQITAFVIECEKIYSKS